MACKVYIACKMTGRDKHEMVERAKYVCAVLRQYGITPISPVMEENVDDKPEILVNDNRERLHGYWKRDKWIIRRLAHVVLLDGADAKSFGMEREYALSRYCIWKPTVLLVPNVELSVATFEDDFIHRDVHSVGKFIRDTFGTRRKRWNWRIRMLLRSLPQWFWDQILAWR